MARESPCNRLWLRNIQGPASFWIDMSANQVGNRIHHAIGNVAFMNLANKVIHFGVVLFTPSQLGLFDFEFLQLLTVGRIGHHYKFAIKLVQ